MQQTIINDSVPAHQIMEIWRPHSLQSMTRLRHKCVVLGRYEAFILDSNLGSGVGVWGPAKRG
jgi:hypothetical protein